MQSKDGQGGQSFLEAARRAQIVECAIEAVAELGYAQASLVRIAERAGISKGVILYHFGGKDELIEQVVAEIFAAATAAVRPRLEAEASAAAKLRAYIDARIEFLTTHRSYMLALFDIWISHRTPDGALRFDETTAEPTVDAIEQILCDGQGGGEFGEFDAAVTAMAIRQAIDGVLLRLRTDPGLDLDVQARELVALFDRATRREA